MNNLGTFLLEDFILRNVLSQFIKYAGRSIIGMLFISGYILADTFFVSKAFGAEGLAALNFSISVFSIIHGTGLMLGIGGGTKFAFDKTRNKDEEADKVFFTTMVLGAILSVIFVFTGLFCSEDLAKLLGADAEIIGLTSTYLKTILIFAPAFLANNILLAFVRNDHAPRLAMIGMIFGSLLNILLDYIFMFPLNMGIFGAAFATCLAPICSILILLLHFLFKNNSFIPRKTKLKAGVVREIFALGLSAFIAELSSSIALIVFNIVIFNIKGNTGVAAYGIIANIALVVIAMFNGVAQGIQPIASRNSGEGDYQSIKKVCGLSVVFCVALSSVIYAASVIYANEIIRIFNSEGNMILAKLAHRGIIIYFVGFFFAGINISCSALLSSINCPKPAFAISITRACVASVPLVISLSMILDMEGVWLSFVFTEFIAAVLSFISIRKYLFSNQKSRNLSLD